MDVIRLVSPVTPLREFVRFYAHREVRAGEASVEHPSPARIFPVLEFIFRDPIQVMYPEDSRVETSPRAVLVGPQTRCQTRLEFRGTVESFVILFQPTGLQRLFSVPLQELTDRHYDAHSVLGRSISQLEQMLGGCRSLAERVLRADAFLLRRVAPTDSPDRIAAAASRIVDTCGNSRVRDIAADFGWSVRQFERHFARQLGVSPKQFARIVRFEAALDCKARWPAKSWTDVAHELGYYDQMHMVHDFDLFTGGTPTSTLGALEVLFRERLQVIRSSRLAADASQDLQLVL